MPGFPVGEGWGKCPLAPGRPDLVSVSSLLIKSLINAILVQSHPTSFGSKKWKPTQMRSIKRVFVVDTWIS